MRWVLEPLSESWGAHTAGRANSLDANSRGGRDGSGAAETHGRSIGHKSMRCRHTVLFRENRGAWIVAKLRAIRAELVERYRSRLHFSLQRPIKCQNARLPR